VERSPDAILWVPTGVVFTAAANYLAGPSCGVAIGSTALALLLAEGGATRPKSQDDALPLSAE
jgi:hypothetical protein